MSKNKQIIDDDVMVTVALDDGEEMECEILTIFELNGQDYIVLEPAETFNDPNAEEADLFIYRYFENGDDYSLEYIDDEEEFDAVMDRVDELMDEILLDDILDENE